MTLGQLAGLVGLMATIAGAGWQIGQMRSDMSHLQTAIAAARADIAQLEGYILEFHMAR